MRMASKLSKLEKNTKIKKGGKKKKKHVDK